MCDPCGYPCLDLRTGADINIASTNMADDARRRTSIHGQEAQLYLSRPYTFRQAMSLRDDVDCAIAHPRKEGNSLSKLVHSKFGDTTIGMMESWCLLSKITQKPLGPGGVDVHIDESAMYQLEESINFATTRHESKTVLNDAISVTASMQTQETKWNDSDQAFISKSRSWRISTIIDQLEPVIDDPLLLSDYPTQEKSDLLAMRAWISASTSPPGGVLDAKSAWPTAGRR